MDDALLADGTYDVLVVGAEPADDAVALDLTVVAGEAKGEVVTVRATGMVGDPVSLLGLPATLTVVDGAPTVRLEP
ncbi:MAG: hypothetical protein KDB35_12015 [Acidimicrobiales bacterium]|nr:hypothetical protein [Acidimicrobiales bacterium]MCB1016312.1 hypothetical protein [Acidimicrobiales bacterium]MCB9373519.1 hypothetical protein [Microthrixaceae bacterium]